LITKSCARDRSLRNAAIANGTLMVDQATPRRHRPNEYNLTLGSDRDTDGGWNPCGKLVEACLERALKP